VTWQCTTVVVIDRVGSEANEIILVMDRPSHVSRYECTFKDAVGVEVRESRRGFGDDLE